MLPAYATALGTQSSAATIPVTLAQTIKNGVSKNIATFVIPLCATIHLSGSALNTVCRLLDCQPGDLLEYVADEIPNAETIAAIKELDNGGGEHFTGSTEELFKKILSEPDEATGK